MESVESDMPSHPEEKAERPPRSAHGIFAPAIRIVNRLKYLQKFILISACFAVPIAVAMFLLIDRNIDYWEDFTRKEVEGLKHVSDMRELLDGVQTHRALSMIAGAGDQKAVEFLLLNEAQVELELKVMDGFVEKLPDQPAKDKWKAIRAGWLPLSEKEGGHRLSAGELYTGHNSLIADLKVMTEMTAYSYKLMLDPDGESFSLINLLVRDLPPLTERIKRLNAMGSYVLSRKMLGTDEKEELIAESNAIRGNIETLKGDVEILDFQKGIRSSELTDIKAGINRMIAGSGDYPKLVDARILRAAKLDMPPWEFFDASAKGFFEPIYRTYGVSEAELLRMFSARERTLRAESMIAWGAAAVVLTLVLYLLTGFYFSVTDTVSRLGAATRQMTRTGLPEIISLESRDELNEVVTFFNEVAVALRRSHEVLLLSEHMARIGSWNLDASGTMHWSPEMYGIYQLDPATAPGIEALYLKAHPEDAPAAKEKIEEGVRAGRLPLFEYRIVLDDGSVRHLSCEGAARSYAPGRESGMTGFAQDITERKRAEEDIRKLNEELRDNVEKLEEANGELEAFNFSLAHDLSTPLRVIDGFSKMLEKYYSDKLDEEGKEFIRTIRGSAQKMGELISELLNLSRLGRGEIIKNVIDMTGLARSLSDDFKKMVPERNLEFRINELPPALGERTLMRQVFFNLMANAVKFTRPRLTAVIEAGGYCLENENIYYVKDNGVGFDMKHAGNIFGVFKRLHTEKEFEGTGAGLAIVQRIIQRHGGRVWAKGAVNNGATFYFSLPK